MRRNNRRCSLPPALAQSLCRWDKPSGERTNGCGLHRSGSGPILFGLCSLLALSILTCCGVTAAQQRPLERELFVPYDDLNVILEGAGRRVFLTREEYEALLAKASKSPDQAAPHKTALLSAEYDVTIEDGRARIAGKILIEVAADGLQTIPLELDKVGLRHATLDGQPASISRPNGKALLFIEGQGRHELLLDIVVPVEVSAARQTVRYALPSAATGRLRVKVPGNIEVKSGAQVLRREVDEAAGITRFELLPSRGPTTLVMTLNNKLAQRQQVVVARSVIVDELTETYERLHITASLKVIHGAASRFRFEVPQGFEITDVATASLSRWEVVQEANTRVLQVFLRSPATDNVVLNLSAQRTPTVLEGWEMPTLKPLDVVGSVSVVGLLVEERLRLTSLVSDGLIPIDTQTLTDSLPPSVLAAEPGAPLLRPVAAFYAPQAEFDLTADVDKPVGRVEVTSNILLIVRDAGLEVRGGFALLPLAEKIFDCNFSVEPGWHVTEVTYEGQPLALEQYEQPDGSSRMRITLPRGVPPGEGYSIHFHATHTPDGWLDPWQSQQVRFPQFAVAEATSDRGAVAVQVRDDFSVRPAATVGLTPLDENKKAEFNLADVPTSLAYRYDTRPLDLTLTIERTEPRITAETYSFLKIEASNLRAHYEIIYHVADARTRELSFLLPVDTPSELSIRGLGDARIKEFFSEQTDADFRRWTLQLARPSRGTVHIAVSFQQRLDMESAATDDGGKQLAENLQLPIIRAADGQSQTGVVAVEGSAELEVTLNTQARKVDVGELVDAQYRPGRRLLGAFGFIGQPDTITASVTRPAGYGLPAAIVQRGQLVTVVSAEGLSQTAARFMLRTKAQFLEVQLPSSSTLWSAYLDQKSAKPQRDGDRLLISLPMTQETTLRDLQIVYETPVRALGILGSVALSAPLLLLREADQQTGVEVPLADLDWHVYLPAGYRLVDSRGTVYPNLGESMTRSQIARGPTPLEKVAGILITSPRAGRLFEAIGTDLITTQGDMAKSSNGVSLTPALDEATAEGFDKLLGKPAAARPAVSGLSTSEMRKSRSSKAVTDEYWALEGLRSLRIDLAKQGDAISFQSLGDEPLLDVTLVDQRRANMLAWGLALLVITLGMTMFRRPVGAKLKYIVMVLIVATVLPLALGWSGELEALLDLAFYAALALIPLYLAAGCARWLSSVFGPSAAQTAALLLVITSIATVGRAAERPPAVTAGTIGPLTVHIVQPEKPVHVPPDAVIVPYNPEDTDVIPRAEKVIVPYEKYVQLWNLAYPDKKLGEVTPPVEYSLSGAHWRATLDGEQYLRIEGQIELDVFVDKLVAIPLALNGGVLVRAELDNEPARIQLVQANPTTRSSQTDSRTANAAPSIDSLATLYAAGKGHKRLELAIRYRLLRRGGWRVVDGRVPTSVANALTLTVPQPQTELRLTGVTDRAVYETSLPNESIETALAQGGTFRIQWRPRVAQATVDRSLTVESNAVLDVQEDSVRLVWQLDLKFPLSQREFFTIEVPGEYLVEQVVGENVRSWDMEDRQLRVTLLKAARDSQRLTLHLARRGRVGSGRLASFEAPLVQVRDALLHEGRLAVRRSPLLELRVLHTRGLTRTDVASVRGASGSAVESPLGIRPFQAYRFSRTPFALGLSATPIEPRLSAEVQTVLRISEIERTLESRVALRNDGRSVYALQLDLPAELRVGEVVAPGDFQWSVDTGDDAQLLRIFLTQGQSGDFSVVVRGMLVAGGETDSIALPRITVDQIDNQESMIVVQTDPGFDARVAGLDGCQTVLLREAHSWLAADQRKLARLAIHCPTPEFSGQVLLEKRAPRVTCQTVSNLRVTARMFEETILLDFTIQDAGIRQLSILLPASLRDARVTAPMVRQKTIEDVADTQQVRLILQLQDEVMGQFRVLIENDRLLSTDPHPVPVPVVETGRTVRRFVSLESVGRDEVLVVQQLGLEPLSRQQQQWRILAGMLGQEITQAFLVNSGEASPRLVVRTKDRQTVETAGARIPLAQTRLTMDASGAYRGVQTYQVDNRTEQFLEVTLPRGARLWTARVATQPVKPIMGQGVVRIPLVKTAEGDQDYTVELKYGGRVNKLARWAKVDFPLMRTKNIHVEESQVRLWLPETHRWFRFGGSMRLAEEESDLVAGYLKYKTEQLRLACVNLASSNPFTQVRAETNVKQLAAAMQQQLKNASPRKSARWQREYSAGQGVLRMAEELLVEQEREEKKATKVVDNRRQLNEFFYEQSNEISRNLVNSQDGNFDVDVIDTTRNKDGTEDDKDQRAQIAGQWFDQSGLSNKLDAKAQQPQGRLNLGPPVTEPESRTLGRRIGKQKGYTPDVAAGEAIEELKLQKEEMEQKLNEAQVDSFRREQGKLHRFRERLERDQQLDAAGRRAGRGYDRFQNSDRLDRDGDGANVRDLAGADHFGAQPEAPSRQDTGQTRMPRQSQHGAFDAPQSLELSTFTDAELSANGRIVAQSDDNSVRLWSSSEQTATEQPPLPTGLASLDIQLPERGIEYLFTTPRGEIHIVSHAIDQSLLFRLIRLTCVLVGIAVVGFLYRRLRHFRFDAVVNRGIALLLVVVGSGLLLFGLVPLIAFPAVVLGCIQIVRLTLAGSRFAFP